MLILALFACKSGTVQLGEDSPHPGGDDSASTDDSAGQGGDDSGDSGGHSGDSGGGDDTGTPAPTDCEPYLFVANTSANLKNGATVDSFDGSAGPYDAAKAGSAASVAVNSAEGCAFTYGATINGDLWVGGDPKKVVCEEWGAALTGKSSTLAGPVDLKLPPTPGLTPKGEKKVAWGETLSITADDSWEALTVDYGATVEVKNSAKILVTGPVSIAGPITIAEGATLELWVEGELKVIYGGALNSAGSPSQLRIFQPEGDLKLEWGTALSGVVKSPRGAFTNAGAAFSGTWMGQSATAEWGSAMHLDSSRVCE